MSSPAWWHRRHVTHAVRVAVVSTIIIAIIYVLAVVAFNTVDRHRLVGGVDDRLGFRLAAIARDPASARSLAEYDNAHDIDDAPVFVWQELPNGSVFALTPGAPVLVSESWLEGASSKEIRFGNATFLLRSERIGSRLFFAAQTLSAADRVSSDLTALELLAGPVFLLGIFLGTLLIGVKAAAPIEFARRRQIEFTADASHELRTPLSVIEAEVSLCLNADRSDDQYRETLRRIQKESSRLEEIVEDLLWLSRFDSTPPTRQDLTVDVGAIGIACADRFDAVAHRRGMTLCVRVDGDGGPFINAPPEWVDRLVTVLVDNACRYAGWGGTVQIGVHAQGHGVWLIVEDSGPGIAAEDRPYLFDRFHRATDEGNGAGLGLAIGDSIVRATGGQWRIGRSELGGALMEVRWPRSPLGRNIDRRPERPPPSATDDPHPQPLATT